MLMASLESVLLDKKNKTLYIAYIAFLTLFSISATLFNSYREMIVKLANSYLYLIRY